LALLTPTGSVAPLSRVVSSASPTPQDMEDWATVADAMSWAGFSNAYADPTSLESTWLEVLGYSQDTPLHEFGSVPKEEYEAELAGWKVDGVKPNLATRNRARQAGHAARVFLSIDMTIEQAFQSKEREEARRKAEIDWYASQPPPSAIVPQQVLTAPPATNMVTFKDVADVTRTDEVRRFSFEDESVAIDHYLKKMSARRVPEECEPSAAQLAVLDAILKEKGVPFVDFAIWGPHGIRAAKAISYSGLVLGPDGTLIKQEMRGPPTIEHWVACFEVYRTAMIMLDAADPPSLKVYGDHIAGLAKQFGPDCWALIYQADSRFR
jgi:hypothetical protein